MKIALLNTSDTYGGAAKAAHRLHLGLLSQNIASEMVVQKKSNDDCSIIGPQSRFEKSLATSRPYLDLFLNKISGSNFATFSTARAVHYFLDTCLNTISPDIIHLHWICRGMISIEQIRQLNRPIVWTLHDMWPFTGGCHYSGECTRYITGCENCPQISQGRGWDICKWIWNRKRNSWKDVNMTIVTPSRWLAECARNSRLFRNYRIEVIPNGINTHLYKPIQRSISCKALNLPENKKLILFGAMDATSDRRKGFKHLELALKAFSKDNLASQTELLVFGASEPHPPPDIDLPTTYLGHLDDEHSLAMVYSAADAVIVPSLEDNLPNIVMEAMACGTPCVAFDLGGLSDMIDHKKNGYLAQPFDPVNMAEGIKFVLGDEKNYQNLSSYSREKVLNKYDINNIAQKYQSLYNDIISEETTA